jgi:hypothetical protein
MDEEMVAKIHDYGSSDLPERTKLALQFTECWVMGHGQGIDGDLLREMRQHYTDEEIVELAYIVARYDVAHRFNVAFGLEKDAEDYYTFGSPRVTDRMRGYLEELKTAAADRKASGD